MYIISGFTGIVKNYFLLLYSRHKKPDALAGYKNVIILISREG